MRTPLRIVASALIAFGLVAALAAPASAGPGGGTEPNKRILLEGRFVPYLPAGQAQSAPSHGVAAGASAAWYPSGCGFYVAVWKQGSFIVGSTLTACSSTVSYIYQGVVVERSRWYGWEPMLVNADETYNSSSLAVDVWYDCSGTGTHNFRSVGNGRLVKNGTTYYASAYDQINNIRC